MKLFLVCGCSDGTDRTNGLHVLRQLRARGHEVTLFDLSMIPFGDNEELSDSKEFVGQENLIKAVEVMKRADAVVIVSNTPSSYIPRKIFELVGLEPNNENLRKSCVWDNCGVSCTIVANMKRRQRVVKELWAILNSSYDRLDFSDFLPFGLPKSYYCDPKLETAGPCVV